MHSHPAAIQAAELFWCRRCVSKGFTILAQTSVFGDVIAAMMMLGLLLSLQSFTMNRHQAERDVRSPVLSLS